MIFKRISSLFECKACLAKDDHIQDLKAQLERHVSILERIVLPQPYQAAQLRQADIALGGAGTEQEPVESEDNLKDNLSPVERQALSMLTGNY